MPTPATKDDLLKQLAACEEQLAADLEAERLRTAAARAVLRKAHGKKITSLRRLLRKLSTDALRGAK